MRFYNRVAVYDDFGGLGFEEESNKMANLYWQQSFNAISKSWNINYRSNCGSSF